MQEFFKWAFLPVELERGTKTLQLGVCCEAIYQNFDCGCILKKRLHKFTIFSESKQGNYNTEMWNYWLKEQP